MLRPRFSERSKLSCVQRAYCQTGPGEDVEQAVVGKPYITFFNLPRPATAATATATTTTTATA